MPGIFLTTKCIRTHLVVFFLPQISGEWRADGKLLYPQVLHPKYLPLSGDGTINLTMVFALRNGKIPALQRHRFRSHT